MLKVIFYALAVTLITLSAKAELTEKRFKPTKGGTVTYRTMPFGNDGRREDALKEVQDFCEGEYEITGEGKLSEVGGHVKIGGSFAAVNKKYMNISFDCKEPAKPITPQQ